MKKKQIKVVIERGDDKKLWGKANYEGFTIAIEAKNRMVILKKLRKELYDVHGVLPDSYSLVIHQDSKPLSIEFASKRFWDDINDRMQLWNLGMSDVVARSGVSISTLYRMKAGKLPDIQTFVSLCKWLDKSPGMYFNVED